MKFDTLPETVRVFGNTAYRGRCPVEDAEMQACFAWLRLQHPHLAAVAIHQKNEIDVNAIKGGFAYISKTKKNGLVKGAADIIIPAAPAFVCELKRKDHTQSQWQSGQVEYLTAADSLGAFTCVALGLEGFQQAIAAYAL